MKKLVIAGGTGFLGKVLSNRFRKTFEVIILTRGATHVHDGLLHVHWDGRSTGSWTSCLERAEAVINLSGRSVDCRYNERNRKEIYASRLDSTRAIGEAISQSKLPPKTWINAASATIYRHAEDREMDEKSGEIGEGFSVDVCQRWEKAFHDSQVPQTRKILVRTGIVLGRHGGPYLPLRRMVHAGLGGRQGSGTQYVSWLHEDDFARAIEFLISHRRCEGVYNLTAPEPVENGKFMQHLRNAERVPFGIPAPEWLLELGAILIRTEPELILKSRRVVPRRLLTEGFEFSFPSASGALKNLSVA